MIGPIDSKNIFEINDRDIKKRISQTTPWNCDYSNELKAIAIELQLLLDVNPGEVFRIIQNTDGFSECNESEPFLHTLISYGHEEFVCKLIQKGISIPEDSLAKASHAGSVQIAGALLDRGVDIDQNVDANSMHQSQFINSFEIDLNLVSLESPLAIASHKGYFELVELLLDRGANPNAVDPWTSVLGNLIRKAAPKELIAKIIEKRADVGLIDGCNKPPLFYAINSGDLEIVDLLLKAGADGSINQLYETGSLSNGENSCVAASLHVAVKKGHKEIVERLLSAGAEPNLLDKTRERDSRTPFELAVMELHSSTNADAFFTSSMDKDTAMKVVLCFIERFEKSQLIITESNLERITQSIFDRVKGKNIEGVKFPCRIAYGLNVEEITLAEARIRKSIANLLNAEDKTLRKIIQPIFEIVEQEVVENKNFSINFNKDNELHGCYHRVSETISINIDHPIEPALVHEMTHLVAQKIFKNSCNPYSQDFAEKKGDYQAFIRARNFAQCKLLDEKCDPDFKIIFKDIYHHYNEDRHDAEAFARITQLAWTYHAKGYRGRKLENKLNESIPYLYKYYTDVFIPSAVPKQTGCVVA